MENGGTATSTSSGSGGKLYDDLIAAKNAATSNTDETKFVPGDLVQVTGLAKAPQFNNLEGKVTTSKNEETGRYGVVVVYNGKNKTLALQPKNMELIHKSEKKPKKEEETSNGTRSSSSNDKPPAMGGIMDKAKKILEDPEIKDLVAKNPRFKTAIEECLANPMSVMNYLGDPEMSPLISKVMAKMWSFLQKWVGEKEMHIFLE